ncbi:MAG: hypothetical protein KF832_12970 [Caldilineaceae bacterium]|nr:hypothetical protein [Caldilineaceae bacterium]
MNTYSHRRVNIFPSDEVISCAECDALLEAYLDAELANMNVKYYYAKVWQHLQHCRRCAIYHDWLYRMLSQRTTTSPRSPAYRNQVDLSFLPFPQSQPEHVSAEPAYHTHLRSALLGEPFQLRIVFPWEYLQHQCRRLTQTSADAAWADAPLLSPCLLLKQRISLPEQNLLVKLIAYPLSTRLSLVRLQATLSTLAFSHTNLQVQLQWGKITRIVQVPPTGKADLGLIRLSLLPTPGTTVDQPEDNIFAITFESTP